MLDAYLQQYPDGALAEEALALAIEAALEQREPRARTLAATYLRRYPAGRWRAAAIRAMEQKR